MGVTPDRKNLPIGLAPHEVDLVSRVEPPKTDPPEGKVRSLAEWEQADAVMTLWPNASYIRALVEHGPVKLFADTRKDQSWWKRWLSQNGISDAKVSYLIYQTDSIWIRDYGPWFILDGKGVFGIVDTKYNRPRPHDDEVPVLMAQDMKLPLFQPGLVHTGGNYYNDGAESAFSSTLVYSENGNLAEDEVNKRMQDYLGIQRYTTSPLGVGISIQHMDTFGKLVAPDTWVFSQFPTGSRFYEDSERMVGILKTLRSPYGTPYKIHRLKMTRRPGATGEDYRAYINSFISNGALFFPTYGGDAVDAEAKRVYEQALPGYQIVGVANGGTEWGDSVHCRSRNLLKKDTLFLFPEVSQGVVKVEVLAPGDVTLVGVPEVVFADGSVVKMTKSRDRWFEASLGDKTAFHLRAVDSRGDEKTTGEINL